MSLIPFAPFGALGHHGLGSSILLTSGLRSLASGSAGGTRKNWNALPSPREQFAKKKLVPVGIREALSPHVGRAAESVSVRYNMTGRERHRSRPNV